MLAPDSLHLDLPLIVRSLSWVGFVLLVMDYLQPELSILLKSRLRLELLVPATGWGRAGAPLPATDFLHSGPSLSTRSLARTGFPTFAPDLLSLGSPMSARSPAHAGSCLPSAGMACSGSVSSLPAIDLTHPGPSTFVQSTACVAASTPAVDFLRLAFSTSLQSLMCSSLPFPVLRQTTTMDSPLPASDYLQLEAPLPIRSHTCSDVATSALDHLHLGLSLLARMPLCIDPALPASGKFSFGSSSVSALGKVYFDVVMSAQSLS